MHGLGVDHFAVIAGLVIDEAVWGQGVSRSLMATAERSADAQGYQEVRLRSNATRYSAHAFHTR